MKLNAQVIEKMQSVNLDAVDKETLVDASGFVFDNSLPLEKRAARMLEQLKTPIVSAMAIWPSSWNLPRTAPLSRNC